ncbi:hypothetical protein ELY33_17220 [Vreelandella andesensis]|uniref:Tip attachment protein J domain-containing protein n=1 Tax=Vreelandella andesensis TaxID=447567 RepID=A0A3S0W2S1_9GAMM|nr:hypothetical protein [Halomonas andesensis]RUR26849.1 hypothetical protein ELY33_17220 [Halomonas andesensis]
MSHWLLTVEALDGAGNAKTLRFSTPGYMDPNPVAWLQRIQQPGLFRSGLFAGELINVERSGYGETTLINIDGALNWLVDYAMDGRRATLQFASEGTLTTVLEGTVARVAFSNTLVSIKLRDPVEILQQPHPLTRYAGTNVLPDGLEGTDDNIGGNVKPRLYGQVRNAQPVAVNTSKLIYQVSDQDCTVTAVYDNGIPLDFDGDYSSLAELEGTPPAGSEWSDWEPPRGKWRRYQGYIRVGVEPTGQITCDANAPLVNAGDVIEQIAGESGVTIETTGALNSRGAVRLWVTDEATTAALLDRLVASCAGFYRLTGNQTIVAGLLAPPATPVLTLFDHQIITIDRDSAGAGNNGLPVGRVTWQADRIETVQDNLAGGVTESRRARLASQYRDAVAVSNATLTRHPLADAITLASDLASRSHAQTTANDVLTLLSPRRDRLSVVARVVDAGGLQINQTVRIVTPRLGYSEGRNVLIVGRELDASRNRISLSLWG